VEPKKVDPIEVWSRMLVGYQRAGGIKMDWKDVGQRMQNFIRQKE
jgi:hypothetical protein